MMFLSFPRIAEAANYKSHTLSAVSYLISLEVSPPPVLSQNLSGAPLVTVQLRHRLVSESVRGLTSLLQCHIEEAKEPGAGEKTSDGVVLALLSPWRTFEGTVLTQPREVPPTARGWPCRLTLGGKAFADVCVCMFLLHVNVFPGGGGAAVSSHSSRA